MKKRLLCILLCICMLSSVVVLLSSCKKKPELVSLDGYRVVCDDSASATSAAAMKSFYDTLKKRVAGSFTYKTVRPSDTLRGEQELEILVGKTNRPESAEALAKIKGDGYAIVFFETRIAIVGTNLLFTLQAIDRFVAEFLGGEEELAGIEKRDIIENDKKTIEVAQRSVFVYASGLISGDYIVDAIATQKKAFEEFSAVRGTAMSAVEDSEAAAAYEIHCGIVDREESAAFLKTLDVKSYGVAVKGNHIVVGALSDHMMVNAFALFNDLLKDGVSDADGKKKIFLPADLCVVQTASQDTTFVTDFPRPEGLVLSGSMDVSEENLQYYYTGSGVDTAAYEAYCQKLIGAGYTLVSTNAAEGNIFRTYSNTEKNIMLYVAYNAFKYATKGSAHVPCIRIVSSRLSNANHLPAKLLSQDLSYTRIQNSSITAVRMHTNDQTLPGVSPVKNVYGNNYIVTLEDGSFIIYDGGQSQTLNKERLYKVLLDLYKKGHSGTEPTAEDPIRISAWIISHGHGDHYNLVTDFIKQYASKWGSFYITLDHLIANFTSDWEDDNSGNPSNHIRDQWQNYSNMIKDAPDKTAGFDFIKVHTGQKFYLANAEFEVIFTHEELYPQRLHIFNDSSTVFRMTLHHTAGGQISEGSTTTMLWLGDSQDAASKTMRAMWGGSLKSDMVQVAHHNYEGCETALYQLVSPTCVWWPVNLIRWKQTTHNKNNAVNTVCYNINYNIPSVKYIILSDSYNYTLTITANGPDYNPISSSVTGICNVGEGTSGIAGPVALSKNASTSFIKK
ncbi:MAG: MBL fold metallo-hydrolase [Ruminococcaceae bacterium]|nr:MBL fold metallo-hydrolase [Oscillospiraceae bacterium]